MNVSDPTAMVRESYDRLGSRFGDARSPTKGLDLVGRAIDGLALGSKVLDVGCGPGVPIMRFLVEQGLAVTGIDVSAQQLRIAAEQVPEADLCVGDICEADIADDTYDAIVAWDSVFHIPREKHGALFDRFARWLRPGGRLLVTGGGSAGEFTDVMLGETFFYSGFDPERVTQLLVVAGFAVVEQVADGRSGRGHVVFIAERRGPA
ncbi:MAG: class I SAM-dependent methyltransferase [Deltaproteobacteria bacterium]|nr:class I SAM-dependent methyltransferase [Deltaproteobacteria bacterium]